MIRRLLAALALTVGACLFASPSQALIGLVNVCGNFNLSGTTSSCTLNVTTGNLLVVGCWENALSGAGSVSDTAGNSFPLGATVTQAVELSGFYAAGATGNPSDAITCTNATASNMGIVALQYSAAATSTPLDATATGGSDTSPVTSSPFSTSVAGDVVVIFGAMGGSSGATFTPSAGYTNEVADGTGRLEGGDQVVAGTLSGSTASYTINAGLHFAIIVMAFKAAAGGATCPKTLLLMGVGC